MKQIILFLVFILFTISVYSQSYNGLDHGIDVTYDITADQYQEIESYVLKQGNVSSSFTDLDATTVHYSFNNTDVYLLPCNLDPMVEIDSIMPASNYCQLAFKLKLTSPLYNLFFQYMFLKLVGNQIILNPVYNDPDPQYTMKKEDLIEIVDDILSQIHDLE